MKKLAGISTLLLLLVALAACQGLPLSGPPATPTADQALINPSPVPTATEVPPTAVPAPTEAPLPPLNSPSGPPLRTIHMFTPKDGYGLIANALLLTHDGGLNWFSIPIPAGRIDENSQLLFRDINNFSLLASATDGNGGVLLKTTNGGGTWESHPIPFVRGYLALVENVGYFAELTPVSADNDSVVIYISTDFGATWTKLVPNANSSIPDEGRKTGMTFLNVDYGWLAVSGPQDRITVYQTVDTGATWKPQSIPAPQNISGLVPSAQPPYFFPKDDTNGLLPIDFVAKETGDRSRVFYASNDRGATWLPGSPVNEGGVYSFIDPLNGWVWGKGGIYATIDGGLSWQLRPVAFGRSEKATAMSFVDTKTGWLLTVDARNRVRIYTTTDSGSTWLAVNP